MGGSWRLLERPVEYDTVHSALTTSAAGGIVLVGAAGVGKTTLARTVTADLDAPVRWAACTESSRAIPLGAFAPWIRDPASRDPLALLSSARENLIAGARPVVGVDDAHLLDQLSATLLHQIAVEGSARIVATVRAGEPLPGAVLSLWKDGYLERYELAPLAERQCVELVEAVLSGPLEGLSADVMWERSAGNPLYLRNMVEAALATGGLSRVDGIWQLRGPAAVPSGLAELLHERLARAEQPVRDVLTMLALHEPFDLELLVDLEGEEAVDAAELAGLITIGPDTGGEAARFTHPLLGEVVRSRLGRVSARRRRGRIVAALRDHPLDTAAERIRMAQLCVDSDQPVDTGLLIAAAKDAVALSDLPLGEKLARAARDRGGGLPAAELLSRALLWQGHPRAAYAELAGFDPAQLDEFELLIWGLPVASLRFWAYGDAAGCRAVLTLMTDRVEHPALRLAVDAIQAMVAVHENRIDDGITLAEHVLAQPNSPRQAVDFAAFAAGLAMPPAGRGLDFAPIAVRCRATRKPTDGIIRAMIRYGEVLALISVGNLDAAERRACESGQFATSGQFAGWAIEKISVGAVAVCRGRLRDAVRALEQALAALAAESALPWQLPAQLLLARAYATLGDVASAEQILVAADRHSGSHTAVHEPHRLLARAWVAAADHNCYTAVEFARAAADLAHRSGQYGFEAEALHHAARFGDRTVAARLDALRTRVQGPLAGLYARHAAAVAEPGTRGLAAVSLELEHAGLLPAAADAAAQAVPRHDHAGQRRLSAEATARALRLAARCDGATTPALVAVARPLPITAREREITALIARGLTNREIAERLVVSTRTVEGHIYRACGKLDATDREHLAALVWPHDPPELG
ncbi:LuxR C-terminal-related transcriptional regulator [Nocardia jiangsuensis]|uniref:LuxR C-terminal-related transcriptional regulator n=1 Tax=Nocardia jiangsuensis TaxID=1691563 RepID=A0ABV8E121_9NOCA